MGGNKVQQPTIKTEHIRMQTAAQGDCITHDRLEYWLRVGRRGTYQTKNFCGRRQLLKRLVTLAV
jgi:hypothetical protein